MRSRKAWVRQALVWGMVFGLSTMPSLVSGAQEAGQLTAGAAVEKDVSKNVSSYLQWNTPVHLQLEGKTLPEQGEMINTVIMVPIRAVAEASGAQVTWDASSETVRLSSLQQQVSVQRLGEKRIAVDGSDYELDHEAVIEGGTLLVPARTLSLALGLELRWDSASRMLALSARHGAGGLTIHSAAFQPNGDIPVRYAHGGVAGGENISPPVSWDHVPEGTRSFAVVMYDIHPIADNFLHWSVIDIPVSSQGLEEGASGSIIAGRELNGYFGMEPPRYSGDHLYRLAVYALDTVKLETGKTPVLFEQLEPMLKEHMLGYAEVDGFFKQ